MNLFKFQIEYYNNINDIYNIIINNLKEKKIFLYDYNEFYNHLVLFLFHIKQKGHKLD